MKPSMERPPNVGINNTYQDDSVHSWNPVWLVRGTEESPVFPLNFASRLSHDVQDMVQSVIFQGRHWGIAKLSRRAFQNALSWCYMDAISGDQLGSWKQPDPDAEGYPKCGNLSYNPWEGQAVTFQQSIQESHHPVKMT